MNHLACAAMLAAAAPLGVAATAATGPLEAMPAHEALLVLALAEQVVAHCPDARIESDAANLLASARQRRAQQLQLDAESYERDFAAPARQEIALPGSCQAYAAETGVLLDELRATAGPAGTP
jgi:hypothetical protein